MGRFGGITKAIISLNFILVAVIFIASAIYTVNVLAAGEGTLDVKYRGFPSPYNKQFLAETGSHGLLEPGYYSATTAAIMNAGTGLALVEMTLPKIYLTRDEYGHELAAPVAAPEGMVSIKIDILTVSAIGVPINLNYINNEYAFRYYWDTPGKVRHTVLRQPGKLPRHFFEFDEGGTVSLIDPDGTPVRDAYGDVVTMPGAVQLQFRLTIDARSKAASMGNEWNGAIIENLGFKAAHADDPYEIRDVFELTEQERLALDWSETRSFYIMPMS